MRPHNDALVLEKDEAEKKTDGGIILGNEADEDVYTVVHSEKFEPGTKVVLYERPDTKRIGIRDYYVTKNDNVCVSLS